MTAILSLIVHALLILAGAACIFSLFVALLLLLGSVLNDEEDGEICKKPHG